MAIELILERDLPAYWASAIVNDDYSSLTDGENSDLKNWLTEADVNNCIVEVSEDSHFGRFMGMGCDLFTYKFYR